MVRVKRGVIAHKRREKILKYTKGFKWGRKSKERMAREALLHSWSAMFRGRKERKREFRKLWQIKIGAAARIQGMPYNALMNALKTKKITLDRKVLAELAEKNPEIFAKIVEKARDL